MGTEPFENVGKRAKAYDGIGYVIDQRSDGKVRVELREPHKITDWIDFYEVS